MSENTDWFCSAGVRNCPVCVPPDQARDRPKLNEEELKKAHLLLLNGSNEIILLEG